MRRIADQQDLIMIDPGIATYGPQNTGRVGKKLVHQTRNQIQGVRELGVEKMFDRGSVREFGKTGAPLFL